MFLSSVSMLVFLGLLPYFIYLKIKKKASPKKLGWVGANKKISLIAIFVFSLISAGLAGMTPEGAEISRKYEAENLMRKINTKNKEEAEKRKKANDEKIRKEKEAKAKAELKEKEMKAEEERKKKADEEKLKEVEAKRVEDLKKSVQSTPPQPRPQATPQPNRVQPQATSQPNRAQPQPQPAPQPTPPPIDVSFKNCQQVRAAGRAPIHAGQPGYGRHLDRDGDGVACE
jgi:conserved domain protein